MSQMAYHWEARFRQRQVDKAHAAKLLEAEKLAEAERLRSELAAKQAYEKQQEEDNRKKALQKQIQSRDKSGIKNSYREREQPTSTNRTYHYKQGNKTLTVEM